MRAQGDTGEASSAQPEPWLAALASVSAGDARGNAGAGAGARSSSSEAGPPRRSPRVRAAVGAVVVLGLLGLGTAVVVSLLTPGGAVSVVAPGSADPSPAAGVDGSAADPDAVVPPSEAAVIVHVLGAVARPGIVEVNVGDRVIDAIAAAGGTTDAADVARINLARELVDGEQLYVPAVGEEPPAGAGPGNGPGGAGAGAGVGAAGAGGSGAAGLVNLNTADAAALETLPGVGPALATRILAWRDENGPFRAVDELLAVAGIGEKTLAGFRDLVTV